ncbi:LTA synthase family protein [Halopseudomonas pelagia]|uniref:LTA synthase family protein n=1 Tax=Halopseudomonas pelagia TaxID=553151 RepID=UPI0003A04F0C|nr:LTA synthase family protein [Halopseudomonas pelagia]|tara:strand:- start:44154 stop:46220 length:2067 start_codon:yes stop_codon:yes gene_type:complete
MTALSAPGRLRPVVGLRGQLLFVLGSLLALTLMLSLLRAVLLAWNWELAAEASRSDLLEAFANGLRFDLRVVVLAGVPLILSVLSSRLMAMRRLQCAWLTLVTLLLCLLGMIELNFYREFHQRLNALVFQYLQEDPGTVLRMLWYGFPVVRLLLAMALLSWVMYRLFSWLDGRTRLPAGRDGLQLSRRGALVARLSVLLLLMLSSTVLARGTLRQGPPLRWGDAFTTDSIFANQLGLTPALTLYAAAKAQFSDHRENAWLGLMDSREATEITRELLLTEHDQLLDSEQAPVRRLYQAPADGSLPIRNVVVILMESFAGHYVGALGSPLNITPEFDRLSREGLLFTRYFSNGTHTHQGMFASMACFPNLPGFEYLMQEPEGGQQFSGLPQLLGSRGFNDLYVYNGDFAWDNQKGFFGNQGMSRFIGRSDYINPVMSDATWGVSDQDMFDRAAEELGKLDPEKPFYALLQTLSNHTPYALPDALPIAPISGQGVNDEHLTAMRYSDWALGRFFERIRNEPYYQDTLFVILGDHGFGTHLQLTELDLLRFHVPMLLIAPGITERFGARNDVVGTQVDMVPTIMGRLGGDVQHQCWGRDLLSLPAADTGFGVIKPSGGGQTVGMLNGDELVVQPRGEDPRAYRYWLGADPGVDALLAVSSDLREQLTAYVQTATEALLDDRAGVGTVSGKRQ